MENSMWTDSTFKSVELFVQFCLVVSFVKSHTDLRPRNVSIVFVNDFCLKASWAPPEGIDGIKGCEDEERRQYEYCTIPCPEYHKTKVAKTSSNPINPMIKGGTLQFSLQTICNRTSKGEPVVYNITTNPELVHDFQCALHSSTDANCSWTPSSHVPDLRLFYWIGSTGPTCGPLSLKECVIFPHPDNVKRVCHISEDGLIDEVVYFLFNGTLDNMFVRNTFHWEMNEKVRPPALKWTLVRDGDYLRISWTPPDILTDDLEYLINYTECNITKNKSIKAGETSWSMPYTPRCQYRIKLKATGSNGETPWSDEKVYGDNVSPHAAMINAAVIALLLVTTILFLAFCAVSKYKEQIFPRIPVPKDFLKDMLENNNKCPAEKLYVPVEETEDTRICLMLEPQVTKLDAEIP